MTPQAQLTLAVATLWVTGSLAVWTLADCTLLTALLAPPGFVLYLAVLGWITGVVRDIWRDVP